MFSLLLVTTSSYYIDIGSKRPSLNDIKSLDYPLFIRIYIPFSRESQQSVYEWVAVANSTEFRESIVFGDVFCENNTNLCEILKHNQSLNYYWIDPNFAKIVHYKGTDDRFSLAHFLRKQQEHPFHYTTEKEIEKHYKHYTNGTSNFVFRIHPSDIQIHKTITTVAQKLRSLTSNILVEFNATYKKPQLEAILSFDRSFFYDGDWSESSLISYIKKFDTRFFSPFSFSLRNSFRKQKVDTLIVITSQKSDILEINKSISNTIIEKIPVSVISKETSDLYSSFGSQNGYAYFNTSSNQFAFHQGYLSSVELNEWISLVEKSDIDMEDLSSKKSITDLLLDLLDEMQQEDIIRLSVALFLILVFSFIIIFAQIKKRDLHKSETSNQNANNGNKPINKKSASKHNKEEPNSNDQNSNNNKQIKMNENKSLDHDKKPIKSKK